MSSSSSYAPYPPPTEAQASRIVSQLEKVRSRISSAHANVSSLGPAPRLVAVSKLHPPSSILAAHVDAKQDHFGENYVQEMRDKAKVLPRSIRWHYVGMMQTGKAKMLADIPNLWMVETLDSPKSATALDKALSKRQSSDDESKSEPLRVLLQVNTSSEDNKAGLASLSPESSLQEIQGSELYQLAKHIISSCPHLRFSGLMTIGSRENSDRANNANLEQGAEASKRRSAALKANPDFETLVRTRSALLKGLRSEGDAGGLKVVEGGPDYGAVLQGGSDGEGALELSMGMSADLEAAVEAGSANVRVGTDCFGVRLPSRDEAMEAMRKELEWDLKQA